MHNPIPFPNIPPGTPLPRSKTWSQKLLWLKPLYSLLNNHWCKFALRLGCTILLLAYLLQSVSWEHVLSEFQQADQGLLCISFMIGLLGIIISAYQWQSLLAGEGIHFDLKQLVNLYLVGIAFNHFLPTGMGGDVIKAYYTGKDCGNHSGSISAVMMSRITGFIGMMLISLPISLLFHYLFRTEVIISFLLSCLAMCVTLSTLFFIASLLPRLVGTWLRIRIMSSIARVGSTLCKSITRPRSMCEAIVFGMFFHISAAFNFYCYAHALHIDNISPFYFLVIVPFISLIAFLPISINGFGIRESTFVYFFSHMNLVLVSPETALVLIFFMDFQVILHGIIGGFLYLFIHSHKEKSIPAKVKMPAQELSI